MLPPLYNQSTQDNELNNYISLNMGPNPIKHSSTCAVTMQPVVREQMLTKPEEACPPPLYVATYTSLGWLHWYWKAR